MKTYFFSFYFLILSFYGAAQREADTWVWGTCLFEIVDTCIAPYSNSQMNFDNDSISIITNTYFPGRFTKGTAPISDADGNLLMVFNNQVLFDAAGAVIDTFYYGDFNSMPVGINSSLFLKLNESSISYYLFYSYGISYNLSQTLQSAFDDKLLMAKVTRIDGNLLIEYKNQVVINDSIGAGGLTSCRHANGRDWWIIKSGIRKNQLKLGLLSPTGIQFTTLNTIGSNAIQHNSFNRFNAKGTKFYHYQGYSNRTLYVYDFDRCTGELTNPVEYDLKPWITSPEDYNPSCVSPDGTKYYFSRTNPDSIPFRIELIQLDLNTGVFTSINFDNGYPYLTPNNKHIVQSYDTNPFSIDPFVGLSIIYNPNENANNIIFEQGKFNIHNFGIASAMPNCANYRLGPVDGSVCDSLGINAINQVINPQYVIYPNPSHDYVTLRSNSTFSSKGTIQLFNQLGQLIANKTITESKEQQIDVSFLSPGIYFVRLLDVNNRALYNQKILKQ
jgi:hypothetical protein